jgi:hypothetical protein
MNGMTQSVRERARKHGMDVDRALAFFDMAPEEAQFAESWICPLRQRRTHGTGAARLISKPASGRSALIPK